jgi:zinc D-Ala-D-Ala carboxypeptidase
MHTLIRLENGFYVWPKNLKAQLSPHFSTTELQCRCTNVDCGEQRIASSLVEKLEALREVLGAPLTVTSAFRCRKHQLSLVRDLKPGHTVLYSQHELGSAADIKTADMARLDKLLPQSFCAIGTARAFRHVDLRSDKERRWKYN